MNKVLQAKIIISHRVLRCCGILAPIFFFWLFFVILLLCNEKNKEEIIVYFGSFLVIFVIIAFIIFLGSFLMTLFLKRLTYTLYEDKLTSYFAGPWHYSVTIAYKDIKEVEMKQGIFQRKFNVGSIFITTNATKERAGFEIYNIENYQEVYDFLTKKVAESNKQ